MATSRHIGIGVETTWGTSVAPVNYAEAISEDLQLLRNSENIEVIRSPLLSNVIEQNSLVEGSVTLKGNYQDLGPWLYLLCGAVSSSTAGAPYTHTFSLSSTSTRDDKSATIEVSRGTQARTWRYAGCKAETWEHTVAEGAAEIVVGLVGKSETTNTQGTASYPDNDLILAKHGTTLSLTSGNNLCVTNFSLSINWPLDRTVCHGSSTLSRQPGDTGALICEATLTAIFEDDEMTEYGYFDGSTACDVTLQYTDGTHSITYNLDTARVISATPFMSARERLTADFVVRAYGNMSIVLVNDDASVTS